MANPEVVTPHDEAGQHEAPEPAVVYEPLHSDGDGKEEDPEEEAMRDTTWYPDHSHGCCNSF